MRTPSSIPLKTQGPEDDGRSLRHRVARQIGGLGWRKIDMTLLTILMQVITLTVRSGDYCAFAQAEGS